MIKSVYIHETGEVFMSLKEAADALGCSYSALRQHLGGNVFFKMFEGLTITKSPDLNKKYCSVCGKIKTYFYQGIYFCEDCRKRTRKKHNRKNRLKREFNLTIDDYNKMFEEQNGVCAICGLPEINRRLAVDHNHKTGKVRGLLCTKCNNAIGALNHLPQRLRKAAEYLEKNDG